MERPKILLAVEGDPEGYSDALARAGFEAVRADPEVPVDADMAVIDCDLAPTAVKAAYDALHDGRDVPALLLMGQETPLPSGVGGHGDEVALKPIPADALVYRLQALLIRAGRQLPTESGEWASEETLAASQIAGEGHVVSVFAPKGGVGKTTISVNMAVALRQQTRAEVLLFDADVGVGNVSSVLDVPYRLGLADLADSAPESGLAPAPGTEARLRLQEWLYEPGLRWVAYRHGDPTEPEALEPIAILIKLVHPAHAFREHHFAGLVRK